MWTYKFNKQITRAHCTATSQRTEYRDRPRSIIVCFLDWDTREQVLKAAWRKREILQDGTRIYFDQDFTTKVQQERKRLRPIRKHLQERQVKSHIIYPAKLKVFGKDRTDIYDDADEAAKAFDINIPRSYQVDLEEKLREGDVWKRQTSKGGQQRRREAERSAQMNS